MLLLFAVRRLGSTCPMDIDVCLSENYIEMDDPDRSSNYTVTTYEAESDFTLNENWYRSVSGAGWDMPTEVVFTGQCNAIAPIWIDGKVII